MTHTTYDEVVKLAEQLTDEEKQALVMHLQGHEQESPALSNEDWKALLRSLVISVEPGENFSFRREDWYGDDGR